MRMESLPRRAGVAIFILSLSILVLQVALTRIFSVMTYHHFTYLLVGLALLGFGAAGTVLTVHPRFAGSGVRPALLADCAWLFGLTGGFGLWAVASYLFVTDGLNPAVARYAAETYVRFRVPHHTLPTAWGPPTRWVGPVLGWTLVFVLLRLSRNGRARILGQSR